MIGKSLAAGEGELYEMFLKEMENHPLISGAEERRLAIRALEGDMDARNRLIEAHWRFILKRVLWFWRPGLSLMDLIQEGTLGLMKAIESYDPSREVRLLTYAEKAINQRILRAIIRNRKEEHESLDASDDDHESLYNRIGYDDPSQGKNILGARIEAILGQLPIREKEILKCRYWDGLTLEETGRHVGLGAERVRQLEKKAIMRIRWNLLECNGGCISSITSKASTER